MSATHTRSARWLPACAAALALPALLAPPGPRPAGAAPRRKATLTVAAGAYDRQNTPVPVKLPPALLPSAAGDGEGAPARLELVGPGGPLPLTVDDSGQGVFVLPALAKGKKASYQLRAAAPGKDPPPKPAVEVVREDQDNLWVSVAGRRVVRYQAQGVAPRAGIDAAYVRGGYLHPVMTPSGLTVTDQYPPDHKHHYGIWTAWTHTEYEGRTPDFWNLGQKKARKDHVALVATWSGDAAGGFSAKLSSTDLLATPPKQVLDERWRVAVYRTHAGEAPPPYFLFDLEATDTLVGSSPLVMPEYRYGGLGVRGHADWVGPDNARYLTSEGKDRTNGEGTTARWFHIGGKIPGGAATPGVPTLAGIATLDHPGNFRAPQPIRIPPKEPYYVVSPCKAGKFSIEPGKPYLSRYRFVIAEGAPDRALLDRLWNDYAHPPVITVGK
jgi:hypothetical protein